MLAGQASADPDLGRALLKLRDAPGFLLLRYRRNLSARRELEAVELFDVQRGLVEGCGTGGRKGVLRLYPLLELPVARGHQRVVPFSAGTQREHRRNRTQPESAHATTSVGSLGSGFRLHGDPGDRKSTRLN